MNVQSTFAFSVAMISLVGCASLQKPSATERQPAAATAAPTMSCLHPSIDGLNQAIATCNSDYQVVIAPGNMRPRSTSFIEIGSVLVCCVPKSK